MLAAKLGLDLAGELLGLMHDFGKYSLKFQKYIYDATGLINPDLGKDF
jgi:CRISPR-associated endonuclease/helicase Cas3